MTKGADRSALICSVTRALWGEVGPNLRRVLAKDVDNQILLHFFFDGEPSDEDLESASVSAAEVISDYPDHELSEEVIRCDAPEMIRQEVGWLTIFARRER
ncbi:MAG: hypothetical protein GW855_02835 [Erythrobacter sp.]|nr:hypothetical protein [Erythrobacter sp.]NCQ63983.1 hypothetical protein [Alphaproteobacteria bacterium]